VRLDPWRVRRETHGYQIVILGCVVDAVAIKSPHGDHSKEKLL
jgi:hypothetical protein